MFYQILIFASITLLLAIAVAIGVFLHRRNLFFAKQVERSLKMVPFMVTLPRQDPEEHKGKDPREAMKEIISAAEYLFGAFTSLYTKGLKAFWYGQRHMVFEIIATKGEISFYVVAPVALIDFVEKAVTSQYPDANIEEVEEHNIFSRVSEIQGVSACRLKLQSSLVFPVRTYKNLETEPLRALTNAMSKLEEGDGAAIQILIRPANPSWSKGAMKIAESIQKGEYKGGNIDFGKVAKEAGKFGGALWKAATTPPKENEGSKKEISPANEAKMKAISEKAAKPGFETEIRIIASSDNKMKSKMVLDSILAGFGQFNAPGINNFKPEFPKRVEELATDFIFRFFPPKASPMILNTEELASIFHFPNVFVETPNIKWLPSEKAPPPVNLPVEGTVLGKSIFRGEEKLVKITDGDKRRHVYVIGQTGTGKTTLLLNMILDDIQNGKGVCYIDPHGDAIEEILARIPKERAEDVILFDAGDAERPLGFNVFEHKAPSERDFLIQEMILILYKLYDPGHTGIMGPMYEHLFRNVALTMMADPAGGTFIDLPKLLVDENYLKEKIKYVTDPLVLDFWNKEIAQKAEFHKSEQLTWFVAKFGAFLSNEIMRNIIGQTKSAFDIREVMDSGKILLVNLSKGRVGELNSNLLGMLFVTKIQTAALSRANVPEEERRDFYLYVDEFQNFSTDSFATILSEARKYRLSLTVANQFIGQLKEEIRDAVFGNVGTLVSYRVGPEDAEFLEKQYAPVFDKNDLVNIPNFTAGIKLLIGGAPSRPFNINVLPPLPVSDISIKEAIKNLSRLKYGRDKREVEEEIKTRLGAAGY